MWTSACCLKKADFFSNFLCSGSLRLNFWRKPEKNRNNGCRVTRNLVASGALSILFPRSGPILFTIKYKSQSKFLNQTWSRGQVHWMFSRIRIFLRSLPVNPRCASGFKGHASQQFMRSITNIEVSRLMWPVMVGNIFTLCRDISIIVVTKITQPSLLFTALISKINPIKRHITFRKAKRLAILRSFSAQNSGSKQKMSWTFD